MCDPTYVHFCLYNYPFSSTLFSTSFQPCCFHILVHHTAVLKLQRQPVKKHPHSNKEAFKQNNNPPQWLASSVQYVNLVSKDVLHFKTKQLKPAIVTVWAFPVEFTACFPAANLVGTVCIKTTLHTRAVQNKLPFPFFHIFFVLVKPQHQYYLYILDK